MKERLWADNLALNELVETRARRVAKARAAWAAVQDGRLGEGEQQRDEVWNKLQAAYSTFPEPIDCEYACATSP